MNDIRTGQMRLLELEAEHRELDQLIVSLQGEGTSSDDLALRRLKKRKLQLKDQIAYLASLNAPNEPA
ncbi:MAG: YdcH family protein [Bordetella sp.]|jgi:uncharacterized protein YdcH (DUF465 family)